MVAFGFMQLLPLIIGAPTLIASPFVGALAVANPIVWFDLIPAVMG